MSYVAVKVTIDEPQVKKNRAKQEFDEFLYRYRDFLRTVFVYDPLKIRRFMLEKDRLLREHDLGFYEKSLLNKMYRNALAMQERKQLEILGKDNYKIWFFT